MSKNIVVVGSSNTDMIIKLDRIPKEGETVIGGKFSTAAGGKGANQAVAAARAGGKVTFIGRVGSDMFGEDAINGLAKDNINVEYLLKDEKEPSGVALIFVDKKGENSIAVASGANSALTPEDIENCADAIRKADILLMQLETPIETVKTAARIAAENNVKVIMNPAPAQQLDEEILSCISILTPNETEAELLTGINVSDQDDAAKAAKKLLEAGVDTVIVTLGSKGALLINENYSGVIPAFSVNAVDSTAAGDTFNGALAVGLSEGMEAKDAVVFANAAAALSVTKIGAQTSTPLRSEVDKFLKEN